MGRAGLEHGPDFPTISDDTAVRGAKSGALSGADLPHPVVVHALAWAARPTP
ncbi:hypothetical protein [Nodularia spumigena]|uniref:hypothetical protein n=1 Tax=Nodularia spumigena TaxID=70799 RepID=UPI002B2180E1|nr:hypothetical protein [Nodularia spumigena]MEA5615114.1 hypothetical protein [Nodularia spumigena UHCC 0040]